jgi:transposase
MKILGLDISKQSASAWILTEIPQDPKRHARSKRFESLKANEEGRKRLAELDFDWAVLEPTGVYSRIWRTWLKDLGKPYRLVGHSELAHYRDAWGLQKTDKADCMAMAMYGIERAARPAAWLVERDYTLSDLVAYLKHLNRQKNGYQNNLRQKLIWQAPELYEKAFRRDWGVKSVPGLLQAIAGDKVSAKWAKVFDQSVGIGLNREARSLAKILIAIEEQEIECEGWIEEEISQECYQPYLTAAESCEFSRQLAIALIAAIYPFEQFLDDGRRRITRSLSQELGKPIKKDESLRAFKLACGMGLIFIQSGDYQGWTSGGSGVTREALYTSISMGYIRMKGKPGFEKSDWALIKNAYDKQGIMKVARKWVERFYKALCTEIIR